MTDRQKKIRQIFANLLEDSGDPGQRVRARIDDGSPIKLYAARTFPHKNTMLEIGPIKKAYLPQGFTRPRIKGLNISLDSRQKAGDGSITLLLELQLQEAIDVFVIFVAKVCEEMDALQKPADAVRCVIALIDRWKNFFSGDSELLSEGRQTGLYGELYLMKNLYRKGIPLDRLVKAWTGSRRTNQDYEFGDISIEVKSTAAVDATSVSITNIRQLDETGLESLFLNRVVLDARQGDQHTLPGLINEIRSAISHEAPEGVLDFEEKILRANYKNEHAEHYGARTYSERAIEFYEVREGFPRLLEDDLPEGVTKASYELTLEKCKEFEKSSEEVLDSVRKYCD